MDNPLIIYIRQLYDEDPVIDLSSGVAALDVMTLAAAASVMNRLGITVAIPEECRVETPDVFSSQMKIDARIAGGGLNIIVTVDTQKMTWDMKSVDPEAGCFTDYLGLERYSVEFLDLNVLQLDDVTIARAPMKLIDGSSAYMWFAEVPLEKLSTMHLYQLFEYITQLTRIFDRNYRFTSFDVVTIPALQIKHQRSLDEITVLNPGVLKSAEQRVFMALDESGARVVAETSLVYGGASLPDQKPSVFNFGATHPVVYWLTEQHPTTKREQTSADLVPFAVVITTSDAWLDPESKVSFDDGFFR